MKDRVLREIQNFLELTNEAEEKYFDTMARLAEAKTKLALRQAELVQTGRINGRNEEVRQAQLIRHAKPEYLQAAMLENEVQIVRARYQSMKRTWETWHAICHALD